MWYLFYVFLVNGEPGTETVGKPTNTVEQCQRQAADEINKMVEEVRRDPTKNDEFILKLKQGRYICVFL